jgi:hypothetical protein
MSQGTTTKKIGEKVDQSLKMLFLASLNRFQRCLEQSLAICMSNDRKQELDFPGACMDFILQWDLPYALSLRITKSKTCEGATDSKEQNWNSHQHLQVLGYKFMDGKEKC